MEVVVTGATGKLGAALVRAWSGAHRVLAVRRGEADFRDPLAVREFLHGVDFDVIVNCAAMANPEACEERPAEARLVNAETPAVLAAVCRERGARLVHFSTDYVLAGEEPGSKDEDAPVRPVNVYGQTKLAGERLVLDCDPSALVCRVSWVFGTEPPGFIETFVRRAQAGEELEAVADKFSMPTWADEIARIVPALLGCPDLAGVFHLTHGGEPESWWSSGRKALALARELGLLEHVKEVRPRRMGDIPQLVVRRPVHTGMEPRRLREELGWPVISWEEAARRHFRQLLG